MHTILKAFRYSEDGVTSKLLEKGATADIRADLVAGLEAEGFIGAPATADKAVGKGGASRGATGSAEG